MRLNSAEKTVLVTGGAGFIGANFVRHRLASHPGERMIVLDALTYAGNRRNLAGIDPDRCEFVHGDIRDTELVERLLRDGRREHVFIEQPRDDLLDRLVCVLVFDDSPGFLLCGLL